MREPCLYDGHVGHIRKYVAGTTLALVLVGIIGCAPEPEADTAAKTSAPAEVTETPKPEPTPEPRPGVGPECPTDHCVSVLMTGDLLFHEGLWSQSAIPTNAEGQNFDFVPLLEGQKP